MGHNRVNFEKSHQSIVMDSGDMRRQALVVGINRYPNLRLRDQHGHPLNLTTPVREAEAIARLLELYGGFEVNRQPFFEQDKWQFNPARQVKQKELEGAITNLFTLKENTPDTALLFFTGIGIRREKQPGQFEMFLATSDTKSKDSKDKSACGVSIQWLRRLLKESLVPQQIIWLVCGHSGSLFEFSEDNEDKPGRDRCWIVSSKAEDPVDVDEDDRSPLVKALIQCLNPKLSNTRDWITSHTLKEFIETRLDKDFTVNNFTQRPSIKNSQKSIIITALKGVPEDIYEYINSEEVFILKKFWERTARWFAGGDINLQRSSDLVFIHSGENVSNYFQQPLRDPQKTEKYKKDIQEALGLTFPNDWWSKNSVENLHEFLKCLCGHYYCGQRSDSVGSNLSVGSAYILALMAHRQACPDTDIDFLLKDVKWQDIDNAHCSLFARQDPNTAKASASALYQLFFMLFEKEGQVQASQVNSVSFWEKGRILKITLNWNATVRKNGRPTLAEKVSALSSQKNISFPNPVGNTADAVLRVWKSLLISQEGFMNPGTIYMSGDALIIAGNNAN